MRDWADTGQTSQDGCAQPCQSSDQPSQNLHHLSGVIGLDAYGMHIDASGSLCLQTLDAGLHRPGEEKTVDQRLGYGRGARGSASFIPGFADFAHSFFIAERDELIAVKVSHV